VTKGLSKLADEFSKVELLPFFFTLMSVVPFEFVGMNFDGDFFFFLLDDEEEVSAVDDMDSAVDNPLFFVSILSSNCRIFSVTFPSLLLLPLLFILLFPLTLAVSTGS
jgi:hypothetical protein